MVCNNKITKNITAQESINAFVALGSMPKGASFFFRKYVPYMSLYTRNHILDFVYTVSG